MLKKTGVILALVMAIALTGGAAAQKKSQKAASKQAKPTKSANTAGVGTPNTVLHVITLRWKSEATEVQKKAVIDGVRKMADQIPGIKNIWVKTVKVQGGTPDKPYDAIIAMEFVDEAALAAYGSHPAHDEWYKIYIPIRDESRTHDVSN